MAEKKIKSLSDIEQLRQRLLGEQRRYKARGLISATIQQGRAVERLAVVQNGKPAACIDEVDFYKKQNRRVLENCGRIDPKRIEDAIERGGYVTAIKALTEREPQRIIDEVTRSGLRDRGGAGFPTGVKWGLAP